MKKILILSFLAVACNLSAVPNRGGGRDSSYVPIFNPNRVTSGQYYNVKINHHHFRDSVGITYTAVNNESHFRDGGISNITPFVWPANVSHNRAYLDKPTGNLETPPPFVPPTVPPVNPPPIDPPVVPPIDPPATVPDSASTFALLGASITAIFIYRRRNQNK